MALPETPLGLKELKRLDISHNQLDCIPEKFLHTCSKLETLEASFNHISKYLADLKIAFDCQFLHAIKDTIQVLCFCFVFENTYSYTYHS